MEGDIQDHHHHPHIYEQYDYNNYLQSQESESDSEIIMTSQNKKRGRPSKSSKKKGRHPKQETSPITTKLPIKKETIQEAKKRGRPAKYKYNVKQRENSGDLYSLVGKKRGRGGRSVDQIIQTDLTLKDLMKAFPG